MDAEDEYLDEPDVDFHIDRYGGLWVSAGDGRRRLATNRERLHILRETPEVALRVIS